MPPLGQVKHTGARGEAERKWWNPCDDEGSFWSPVSYVTPARVRGHSAPAPSCDAAPPVFGYISSVPAGYAAPAPVVNHIVAVLAVYAAPTPVADYVAPGPPLYSAPAPVVENLALVPPVHAAKTPGTSATEETLCSSRVQKGSCLLVEALCGSSLKCTNLIANVDRTFLDEIQFFRAKPGNVKFVVTVHRLTREHDQWRDTRSIKYWSIDCLLDAGKLLVRGDARRIYRWDPARISWSSRRRSSPLTHHGGFWGTWARRTDIAPRRSSSDLFFFHGWRCPYESQKSCTCS